MRKLCFILAMAGCSSLLPGASYSVPLPQSSQTAGTAAERAPAGAGASSADAGAQTAGAKANDATTDEGLLVKPRPRIRASGRIRSVLPAKLSKPTLAKPRVIHPNGNASGLHPANPQPPVSAGVTGRQIQNGKPGVVASTRIPAAARTTGLPVDPARHRGSAPAVIGGPKSTGGLNGTTMKGRP